MIPQPLTTARTLFPWLSGIVSYAGAIRSGERSAPVLRPVVYLALLHHLQALLDYLCSTGAIVAIEHRREDRIGGPVVLVTLVVTKGDPDLLERRAVSWLISADFITGWAREAGTLQLTGYYGSRIGDLSVAVPEQGRVAA